MNERIKQLRQALDLSMEAFGNELGVTRSAISRIESGIVNVTNQMVSSVCRQYNVNEEWLRTGNGTMFMELTKAEEAARIVGNVLRTDDKFILNAFIALGQLSKEDWKVIEKLVDKLKKGITDDTDET